VYETALFQVPHGFASASGGPAVHGLDEYCASGGLYPLTEGLVFVSRSSPRYIDFADVESVLVEPYEGRGGFKLCVMKKAGSDSKTFISVLSIANREYPLLREYLAGKGVSMHGDGTRLRRGERTCLALVIS
jgi:hypothetical protein